MKALHHLEWLNKAELHTVRHTPDNCGQTRFAAEQLNRYFPLDQIFQNLLFNQKTCELSHQIKQQDCSVVKFETQGEDVLRKGNTV